jgi:guanine deaminase
MNQRNTIEKLEAFRGDILHFLKDPFYHPDTECYQYVKDGLLIVENGKVNSIGSYSEMRALFPTIPVYDYQNCLILPGMVDTHIHYPQTEMIASYGEQLLEWLNKYTFPTEEKFKDPSHAKEVSEFFLRELLRNGTTTALVLGSVHPESIDAFFEEASALNLRMVAGKVMMDRETYAPASLRDTPETSYEDTKKLIQKWNGKGRLQYAITPRFAVTSTEDQLRKASTLKKEFPHTYIHTHLAENKKETETISKLFPKHKHYLDVYDSFGLLGRRSVFAHSVHLSDDEFARLSETDSTIAFCPTSNLFLGSGLFQIGKAKSQKTPIQVGLGTDMGGGTSFSLLRTMSEGYKVAQLQNLSLSAFKSLYLATLGGAKALALENVIGNFEPGKEADFIVLDPESTPLQSFRMKHMKQDADDALASKLFALIMLGDDRAIKATYIMGKIAHQRGSLDIL